MIRKRFKGVFGEESIPTGIYHILHYIMFIFMYTSESFQVLMSLRDLIEFLCDFDLFRVVKSMVVVSKSKGDQRLVLIHEKCLNMLYFDVPKSGLGLEVVW